jgi:hypothetical protein
LQLQVLRALLLVLDALFQQRFLRLKGLERFVRLRYGGLNAGRALYWTWSQAL